VDQYYYWNVRFIFDSVVNALLLDANRKFVIVEMCYFYPWWQVQSEKRRNQVRSLLKTGQLSFVLGGWAMPDEASPSLNGLLETITEGNEFILREFGVVPRVSEQIDPFGLSASVAALYAQAGFEMHVINRIDYRLKDAWKNAQHLEFNWLGSSSLGSAATMWTHVLDSHYSYPSGVGSDWEYGYYGTGNVVIDADVSELTPSNIQALADQLFFAAYTRSQWFRTPYVLIPAGDDFRHQNALMNYLQMETVMDYINANPERYNNTKIVYSNLVDYTQAAKTWMSQHGQTWDTYTSDFFPYFDGPSSPWTGYFTSRQNVKKATRQSEALMRDADTLTSLAVFSNKLTDVPLSQVYTNLSLLRHAHALVQHHDGVAGTEKAYVADDYLQRLSDGAVAAVSIAGKAMQSLLGLTKDSSAYARFSLNLEEAVPQLLAGGFLPLVVSNSAGITRKMPVEIIVSEFISSKFSSLLIFDEKGNAVVSQYTQWANGNRTLSFGVEVPALGVRTVFVQGSATFENVVNVERHLDGLLALENEFMKVGLDANSGMPVSLTNKAYSVVNAFSVELRAYASCETPDQPSGAYIFRPAQPVSYEVCPGAMPEVASASGVMFDAIVLNYTTCAGYPASVTLRLWKGLYFEEGSSVDLDVTIGAMNVSAGGREAIVRFVTDIQSNGQFVTDDNGYETVVRTRLASRPGDTDAGVSLAGNYYPVASRISIQESSSSTGAVFAVVTAHSHGGSSLADGAVELMVARRLRVDDSRGVGEPLDDTHVVSHSMRLLLQPLNVSARAIHYTTQAVNLPCRVLFAVTVKPITKIQYWTALFQTTLTPVADLPENIQLIAWKLRSDVSPSLVIRLYHAFAVDEDAALSKPVTLDIAVLWRNLGRSVASIQETTWALNRIVSPHVATTVTVSAKQIRTFVISFQ
jgi:hypothetical protein